MLQDLISLAYPRNCVACGNSLYKHEDQICNYCYTHLPKTNFHERAENPVGKLFYGRTNLLLASSFYLFNKKSQVQKMLHAIKYKGNKELAQLVGQWYAEELIQHPAIQNSAVIIPVPLHSKKLKQRGYNQSEEFAKGLSEGLHIPINTEVLQRNEYTSTQTRKSKYERWENVEDKFILAEPEEVYGKKVILVDDVITTGATIEACSAALQKNTGTGVSVLSIAFADK